MEQVYVAQQWHTGLPLRASGCNTTALGKKGSLAVQGHAGEDHARVGSIRYFWPVARLLYWAIASGSSAPASDTTLV